jgi:hypothetical protein
MKILNINIYGTAIQALKALAIGVVHFEVPNHYTL